MRVSADLSVLRGTKWHQHALRFFLGGLVTVGAGLVSKGFGPVLGGLFLAFPAIFPAGATLIDKRETQKKARVGLQGVVRGRRAAALDAAGAVLGSVGLICFALFGYKELVGNSALLVLCGAMLSWAGVSLSLWWLRKKHPWRPRHIALAALAAGALAGHSSPTGARPEASPEVQQDSAGTRYSGLHQLDRNTVSRLRLLFTFRSGQRGSQGSAPLVVGSSLYLLTPFPHTLFALDLTHSPPVVSWKFVPNPDLIAAGLACCERTAHGPVFGQGRIYFSTFDGHVIALDARTGTVAWNVRVADPQRGETLASAPLLLGDRLVIGNAGDDFGARGWILALDPATGHELWRHYSSGPDQDVGIADRFVPRQAADRGHDLGTSTWTGDNWQHSGGSVSDPVVYDPELGLLLHNTGPPAPWNPQQRPGSNRWTSGLFARDLNTGAARWFTVLHSHNLYSWANGTANVATDRVWDGNQRKLLAHPDADGFLYVLDRSSGEVLATDPLLAPAEATRSGTGRSPAPLTPQADIQVRRVCPAWVGAIGGNPALSAANGLLYIPISRLCMDMEARSASYLQGTPFLGANVRVYGANTSSRGELVAWDLGLHEAAWRVDEKYPVASDVLATAGGVVFYGTLDGLLKAVDASTGKLLWEFQASAGIMGQPLTWLGPEGRQYLAVVSGGTGPYGLASEYWIDRRDATAARGLAQAIADLPAPRDPSGTLYVFGLP